MLAGIATPANGSGSAQAIVFIIAAIAVVFGAYYVTRLIGRHSQLMGQGRNIRVRERVSLSRDKSICIIEVQDKIYLIAISNNAVTLLDTLDAETYNASEPPRPGGFADLLRAIKNRRLPDGENKDSDAGIKNDTDDL